MEQWRAELYGTELYHHGIKGMRWGVRRYQNYDGTYTQAGLKRYGVTKDALDKAKSNYESVNARYKSGEATKLERNHAKNLYKKASKLEKKQYKQLKRDNRADKGKEMYEDGKTIESVNRSQRIANIGLLGIHVATNVAEHGFNYMTRTGIGQMKLDSKAANAIRLGTIATTIALGVKSENDRRNLRAYYAHSGSNKNVKEAEKLMKELGGNAATDKLKKKANGLKDKVKSAASDFKAGWDEGMREVQAEQQRQALQQQNDWAMRESMNAAQNAANEAMRASNQAASLSMTNGMNPFMFGGSTSTKKKKKSGR